MPLLHVLSNETAINALTLGTHDTTDPMLAISTTAARRTRICVNVSLVDVIDPLRPLLWLHARWKEQRRLPSAVAHFALPSGVVLNEVIPSRRHGAHGRMIDRATG